MAKKTVSGPPQNAMRKAESTGKKNPSAQSRSAKTSKQKTANHVQEKTTVKKKQPAKKNDFSKIDPSSILKQFKTKRLEKNEDPVRHKISGKEKGKRVHTTKKFGKEILQRIMAKEVRRPKRDDVVAKTYLPVSDYTVTSRFGEDRGDHVHSGVDLSVKEGTSVAAVKSGTVSFAGWSSGYGYRIVIDHGDGSQTTYSHLSDIGVKKGEAVTAGTQIGLSGNTGHSTGPHLHFEVKVDGEYVDPESYFDFGDGLAAPADENYVSKTTTSTSSTSSTSTKKRKASSHQQNTKHNKKDFNALLSLIQRPASESKQNTAYLSPQALLAEMTSSRHFSRRKHKNNNNAKTETNSLTMLIPGYQMYGNQKKTKQTQNTKPRT